jgi:hypothetical protein
MGGGDEGEITSFGDLAGSGWGSPLARLQSGWGLSGHQSGGDHDDGRE